MSKKSRMNICIVGCGYVGLTCAVVFSRLGEKVIGLDKDSRKIQLLKQNKPPIYELYLEDYLEQSGDNLAFTDDPSVIADADIVFIAVQTPVSIQGEWDLSFLKDAVGSIARNVDGYKIIINKCTAPVGTTEMVGQWLINAGVSPDQFAVVSNPEFLKQSTAILDFLYPHRIIIGSSESKATEKVMELYRPIINQDYPCPMPPPPGDVLTPVPTLVTTPRTAEMIKYASNSFLANKISFINEIGNICKRYQVDACDVARGMGLDPRISPHFLEPGLGFGGSCLPKDTRALISMAKAVDYEPKLLEAILEVNQRQPRRMVELARTKIGSLNGKKVAVLGTAFKPNTDDIRESSAIIILEELLGEGATPLVYDPLAMENTRRIFGDRVIYNATAREAVEQSDCVLIVTAWDEFGNGGLLDGKPVIDGRRTLRNGFSPHYEFLC